jgi:Carboxypeptidase regulatory-like domain
MSKRLLSVLAFLGVLTGTVSAQATNNNPAKAPEVFLDNHRPLIKKKDKAPTSRDLTGKVTDSSGQSIEGALVTLTDTKTNAKTTFITKKDGRFNFDDLSLVVDYRLQARFKDVVTEPRNISQYDPNTRIVRILQIDSPSATADNAKKTNAPHQE